MSRMNIRNGICVIICVVLLGAGTCMGGNAPETKRGKLSYVGYTGGMMLHTGYVSAGTVAFNGSGGNIINVDMSGITSGIGGCVKLMFGEHLRLGSEGYVSTLKYGVSGSYASIGWGGILADYTWRIGRFTPFAGATAGFGRMKNLTLTEPVRNDFDMNADKSFRSYSLRILNPFAGIEYSVSSHMSVVIKADWMFNVLGSPADFPSGPRIYAGFLFCRKNK